VLTETATEHEYGAVPAPDVSVPERVYVVVILGRATYVPDRATVPTEESVGSPVALVDVFHANVTASPVAIDEGVAVMAHPDVG
jgi:hypothetical protein